MFESTFEAQGLNVGERRLGTPLGRALAHRSRASDRRGNGPDRSTCGCAGATSSDPVAIISVIPKGT
jgi:hypothetical protein